MKKIIYATFIFALGINMANAKPVEPSTAKTIAQNFYKQNSDIAINTITLTRTEFSSNGLPLYFVFDINANDGFVIVSAEDAIRPIIGYSTKNHSTMIDSKSNIGYWMEKTSYKINSIRSKGLVPNEKVAGEWTKYINNTTTTYTERQAGGSSIMTLGTPAMTPLTQTTWNQNGGGSVAYNNLCPGGSVTGCVATTMAQIMRYWSYPAQGTGSSSYTQSPNANNYPMQSANYGATTYNWANMPLTASNADVAQLMYQCGVSVDMHYDPSGSGAQVLGASGPSAQHSYKTYFSYDPNQLRGLYKSSYSDAAWIDSVKSDLNIGRPVQYVGADSLGAGHTWVCDGYDSNGNLHMNWGWGGAYDGYFSVEDLTTSGGTPNVYDPKYNCSMLKGIVPPSTNGLDAGIPIIVSPIQYYCGTAMDTFSVQVKFQNFGSTKLTACTINYQLDGGSIQTQNWNGSLVSYQTTMINLSAVSAAPGTHTLVCYSSNPNGGTDLNSANDQSTIIFTVTGGGILPIIEGFESAAILPNSNWNISHTVSGGVDFAVTSNAEATGFQSCILNNMNNVAGNSSILQTASNFDMTTFTTPLLTFKAAYQKKATGNADKLQILTSTDCGNSWVSRKTITASTLASLAGGTGTSAYVPTPSQFTTYSVTITAVASSHNVMFRWEFVADPTSPGNNLYIDDINIVDASSAGIESIEASVGLNIYPNPSSGKVNIDLNLSEQHNVSIIVTDMLGRTVETIASKSYQVGETTLSIGANNTYQAGIYLVNINIDGQRISKKVVIQ